MLGILVSLVIFGSELQEVGAADQVRLRDGAVVLGQVLEPSRSGSVRMLVRREWARGALPERLAVWERMEGVAAGRAVAQRKARLEVWARERPPAGEQDRIGRWITAARKRLEGGVGETRAPLMLVEIDQRDVTGVERNVANGNLLRLAWRAGFDEPETRPVERLRSMLEGRGMVVDRQDEQPMDDLIAPQAETDEVWLVRRAVTEVEDEQALRFIRAYGMVLPEGLQGAGADTGAFLQAAGGILGSLLGDPANPPADPWAVELQKLAERGRRGAMLTTLEVAPDQTAVRVEAALWVRTDMGRWVAAIRRPIVVHTADVKAVDGELLANDPQVKAVMGVVESLGLGQAAGDLKRQGLQAGAATQVALGRAQATLQQALAGLELPVNR